MKQLSSAVALGAMLCACPNAQAVATTDTLSLQEVTVTAIKQGTNLRTEATAVTELTRRDIERNHVASGKVAAEMIPNLFMPDYGSRMTSTIYVRGLGTRIDQPAIGLNIDNVPVICKENFDFDIMDISKLEMLRGPQSTLFGRNAMAGVMNIYTLSPFNFSGTRLLAEYGNHNAYKVGASHYGMLTSNFGIAVSAYHTSTDGEYTNTFNGKKCDWEHQSSGRLKMEWMPRTDLFISNAFTFTSSRQGGYPYEFLETGKIAYNDTCFYKRTSILDGLTIKKTFSQFSFNSITSYQYIDDNMTLDQDFTEMPYFTLEQTRKEHAITQDFVLKSRNDDKYSWVVGAFGFYRHYNMDAPVTFEDYGIHKLIEEPANAKAPITLHFNDRQFVLGSNLRSNNLGFALYHQSSYKMGNFTLTGGLRLDYEHAGLKYHSETHTTYTATMKTNGRVIPGKIDINDSDTLKMNFAQLLPKVSLSYRFGSNSNNTIFASVSKGYKSGGYNTQMCSDMLQQKLMSSVGQGTKYNADDILSYKPEKAWNYELGGHFECWNGRVKSDINAFYMDCRDRQLTIFPDGKTTGRMMTNAGKTRSFGAEFAMQITPCEGTGINMSYGYTNAKFVEYNDGKADYKDNYVPYSPSHTMFADAFHTFTLSRSALIRTLTLDANVRGAGEIYWNEANTEKQSFYAQLGASATLAGEKYSLEFWGRNLTDTKYNTFYFVSIGHQFLQRGKGISFGATLRATL